jgi:hypothetical protein
MADAFRLQIPLEAPYRVLVPEVASRYAELSGGTSTDAEALAAALSSAIDRMASDAGPNSHVDLAFRPDAAGVQVDVACNHHRETVRVAMSVARP